MSEDKSSKTENASPKKLRDARKKGQVAKSKDVVSTTILIFLFIYFVVAWQSIEDHLKILILSPKEFILLDIKSAIITLMDVIFNHVIISILLPLALITISGGVIGNLIQTGFLFATDPIVPKMNKISPVSGFKRIFSIKQLKTTGISILKVLSISVGLYFVMKLFMSDGLYYFNVCNIECQEKVVGYYMKILVEIVILITLFISIIDFIVQRASFLKDQKMSKDDQKREYKSMEGDPQIKGKRRQIQQEIANDDTNKKIKESRIIIYSSGLAISLLYNEGEHPLPIISSIGKARMADKMVEIARGEKVPVYESFDIALAIISNKGEIDQYIPNESIEGVVKALQETKK